MAAVHSLGIHTPSALPYLIAENVLSPGASDADYIWETCGTWTDQQDEVEQELVTTKTCVVWSRGGIVLKVFRLDVEGEEIVRAVLTSFPELHYRSTHPVETKKQAPTTTHDRNHDLNGGDTASHGKPTNAIRPEARSQTAAPALVIVLKTQAHVYFSSGDNHIVHLPFEVDAAFPAPRGVLLQRSVSRSILRSLPTAPPNSFASTQATRSMYPSFHQSAYPRIESRPSLTLSPAQPAGQSFLPRSREDDKLPRLFTMTDPLAEMGLVSAWPRTGDRNFARHLKSDASEDLLGPDDEVLYISPSDEAVEMNTRVGATPLVLVISFNRISATYTIWSAKYKLKASILPSTSKNLSAHYGPHSRRRSSFYDIATGATTPAAREPTGPKESFGGHQNLLKLSQSKEIQGKAAIDPKLSEAEQFAARMDPESDFPAASRKASRRVSSMLTRTEVSKAHERAAVSDLANGPSGMHPPQRRGDSFGGYNARESFGHPTVQGRRGENPLSRSLMSTSSAGLLDTGVDDLLEEINSGNGPGNDTTAGLREAIGGLQQELVLFKIKSVSFNPTGSTDNASHSEGTGSRKVFMLLGKGHGHSLQSDGFTIVVCVTSEPEKTLMMVYLRCRDPLRGTSPSTTTPSRGDSHHRRDYKVEAVNTRFEQNVVDACKLGVGTSSRILVLSRTNDGSQEMTVRTAMNIFMKVDMPSHLMMHDRFYLSSAQSPTRTRDEGSLKRIITKLPETWVGFRHPSATGQVTLIDGEGRGHKINIQTEPRDSLIRKILDLCSLLISDREGDNDGLVRCWCEVYHWLQSSSDQAAKDEWTALIVVLFSMAVPFLPDSEPRTPTKKRKKTGLLRSSSGSAGDVESWETMLEQESGATSTSPAWLSGGGWKWLSEQDSPSIPGKRSSRSSFPPSTAGISPTSRKHGYISCCTTLARDFLKTSAGNAASGRQGYLPTAASKPKEVQQKSLAIILVGLHLLREEQKLDISLSETSILGNGALTAALAQIGGWLGWPRWSWKSEAYYNVELTDTESWLFEDTAISSLQVPGEPFAPPSIFSHVEEYVQSVQRPKLVTIADVIDIPQSKRTPFSRETRDTGIWPLVAQFTPRTLAISGFLAEITENTLSSSKTVEQMLDWGLTGTALETLPDGIRTCLQEALVGSQAKPPSTWDKRLLQVVERDDLCLSMSNEEQLMVISKAQPSLSHEAAHDVYNIGTSALETEAINAYDASAEIDRHSVTKLIFRDDRRYFEATKLLNQMRPPVARCAPEPEWTESDLLDAQKDLVQLVTVRTLAVSSGRGLLNFDARVPLLTEKLPIPGFTMSCVMRPSNVTITAERSAFTEEKVCWSFFHAGVSTGLSISRSAKGIETSWILFNKPPELNNRHAGFLLALGLNGHLRHIAKWVAFKYLTPKHAMTSIGLLLGLAASYLGTQDPLITRLLSVHVTCMLPMGSAEMNLSPLTQTTGVMGLGLLYCRTQHRRMSEVMMSEIENTEQEDPSAPLDDLRDESYRLAAGFALGFINLGKGKDLKGLQDMHLVERLLALGVGPKSVSVVHIIDKAIAGVIVAIALMFMKTHDSALAAKIDIPDSVQQYDYVRPDIFLLRTVAKHLIMWGNIEPEARWIQANLPKPYQDRVSLSEIRSLNSEDMSLLNIVAGMCLSIGLRFAGTNNQKARTLLVANLDEYIRICRLPALNYDAKLTRGTVRNCQDVVALAAAAVAAGTGDLEILRRLRSLHGRVDAETPYGSHLASHMALGVLFLGGGCHTFGTSDIAVASLLCAFYPLFPTSVLDNQSHLQAFRHLWVLAIEPRCLIPRDVETRRPISVPIAYTLKDGREETATAPCLLPPLDTLVSVATKSKEYWEVRFDFASNPAHIAAFEKNQTIYLRRRAAYDAPDSGIFMSELQALDDALTTATIAQAGSAAAAASRQLFDWVFDLPALKDLDVSERAKVLPPASQTASSLASMGTKGTAVDARLFLEKASVDSGVRDRLWQLRLLFAWMEREERLKIEGGGGGRRALEERKRSWLKREVVEGLMVRVWLAADGVEEE